VYFYSIIASSSQAKVTSGKMLNHRTEAGLLIIGLIISLTMGRLFFSDIGLFLNGNDWDVTDEGILTYSVSIPRYDMSPPENHGNTTLSIVRFRES
jgi:hypothetical protein